MKLIVTNTRTHVEGGKISQAAVYEALRYEVPNAHAIKRKTGNYGWDGYKSMHNRRRRSFPSGLLAAVEKHLKKIGARYIKEDRRKAPRRPAWPVELSGITLRDYQKESVVKFLTAGQGILKLGTGSGKTECAVAIANACGVPAIFLTHRVNLMHQAAERFALRWPEIKGQIGIVGNGSFDLKFMTFATVQTLHSAIRKYGVHITDDLKKYGLLIIDEAHRVGAKQFHETTDCLPGAYWRLGLTATPFMHDDPAANLMLRGVIGNVIHEVKPSVLINEGVLARPFFKFFKIESPSNIYNLKHWRDIYEQGIVNNDYRNQAIVRQACTLIESDYKPLIIVQELAHGNILKEGLVAAGKRVELVTGTDDVRGRNKALKSLSTGKAEAVIATNIFDEGIDVKDVSAVILAAGTKAAPSLFQRTGRAIRKKEDRNNAVIVDFLDYQHKTLLKHSAIRYELVQSEPEFKII